MSVLPEQVKSMPKELPQCCIPSGMITGIDMFGILLVYYLTNNDEVRMYVSKRGVAEIRVKVFLFGGFVEIA